MPEHGIAGLAGGDYLRNEPQQGTATAFLPLAPAVRGLPVKLIGSKAKGKQ
jgi:hypothetical protein